MKFELKPYNLNATDDELLADLKKVAKEFGKETLMAREYSEKGRFGSRTIEKRFGTWNSALEKAGLQITLKLNIEKEELFKNIEEVWIQLGRQPLYKEIKQPLSKYSTSAYMRKFGTWQKALEAFVEYINSDVEEEQKVEENNPDSIHGKEIVYKHKTKRNLSERLKVQVLMRDGNKCKLCGITVTGENIHFDHIKPWSKGGETVLENIQVLCAKHNLAKGNL